MSMDAPERSRIKLLLLIPVSAIVGLIVLVVVRQTSDDPLAASASRQNSLLTEDGKRGSSSAGASSRNGNGSGDGTESGGSTSNPAAAKARPPSDVKSLQTAVLDTSKNDHERYLALRELQHFQSAGRTSEILASMAALLQTAKDDTTRANICRVLRGADSPVFRQQLLTTMRSDTSMRVREEALDCLAPMIKDPLLHQMVAQAAEVEPNAFFKKKLERVLNPRGGAAVAVPPQPHK